MEVFSIVKVRKAFIIYCSVLALIFPVLVMADDIVQESFDQQVHELEQTYGGRLGVSIWDSDSNTSLHYRGGERFAFCSTFKFLLVAAILKKVDDKQLALDQQIPYGTSDLLSYAPITRKHLKSPEGSMSISQLSAAALQYSDNTAANLLMKQVGGTKGLTAFMQSIGDKTTRFDRIEPDLNSNLPNDERDTTTPDAMLKAMKQILLGSVLSHASRDQLTQWLLNNTTGANKLRSGFPTFWPVGDKTGSGDNGATSDIAITWPDPDHPILVAVYYTDSKQPFEIKNHVIELIGKIISEQFSGH